MRNCANIKDAKSVFTMIDTEELLHFAIDASQNRRHDVAIGYLKQLLDNTPDNTEATYLLGAEYAQIGMFDRAKVLMLKALDRQPNLRIAIFQIGLLDMATGEYDSAVSSWERVKSDKEDYLHCFASGLIYLVQENVAESKHWMTLGIEKNKENEALNRDMQSILESIDHINLTNASKSSGEMIKSRSESELEPANALFLSAYSKQP